MSVVVHASGCTPLLLYVLLYGLDTYASRQLGQTPPATAALQALARSPPDVERVACIVADQAMSDL